MSIETIDELLDFIDRNYERLTEKAKSPVNLILTELF